jgi:hypothetical protein
LNNSIADAKSRYNDYKRSDNELKKALNKALWLGASMITA